MNWAEVGQIVLCSIGSAGGIGAIIVCTVKWSANRIADRLSKKYELMNTQEQVIFLMEAEKVFNAFDKVPEILWEEEYEKYTDVLDVYKNIKVYRWATN